MGRDQSRQHKRFQIKRLSRRNKTFFEPDEFQRHNIPKLNSYIKEVKKSNTKCFNIKSIRIGIPGRDIVAGIHKISEWPIYNAPFVQSGMRINYGPSIIISTEKRIQTIFISFDFVDAKPIIKLLLKPSISHDFK